MALFHPVTFSEIWPPYFPLLNFSSSVKPRRLSAESRAMPNFSAGQQAQGESVHHLTINYLWISLYDDLVPYGHLVSYDHTITLLTLWWHWLANITIPDVTMILFNCDLCWSELCPRRSYYHTITLFTFISLSPYKLEWSSSIRALPKERLGGAALIRFINYLQDM